MKRLLLSMVMLAASWPALAIDLGSVDLLSPLARDVTQAKYNALGLPKVLVISAFGQAYISDDLSKWPLEEMIRITLERCEVTSGAACSVAAINEDLQDFRKPVVVPILVSGKTDYDAIPTLTKDAKSEALSDYLAGAGHKAIAIDGYGAWGTSSRNDTVDQAVVAAISYCNKGLNSRKSCFIYDLDGHIDSALAKRVTFSDIAKLPISTSAEQSDCSRHIWVMDGKDRDICVNRDIDLQTAYGIQPNFSLMPEMRILGSVVSNSRYFYFSLLMLPSSIGKSPYLPDAPFVLQNDLLRILEGNESWKPVGDMEVVGDISIRRMTYKQWPCVGYFRYGSQTPGGHNSHLIGFYCDPWQREPLSDSQIVEAISSVHIKE